MGAGAGGLHWMDAGAGYSLAIDETKLVCTNAKGRRLSSVPAALKDSEVAIQLRALKDWLASHDAACLGTVETWMLRSLPVPLVALAPLWADPSWRRALEDAVVVPVTSRAGTDWQRAGLLRDIDERGAGVVTLEGETERLRIDQLAVPHPVLFDDLVGEQAGLGHLLGVGDLVDHRVDGGLRDGGLVDLARHGLGRPTRPRRRGREVRKGGHPCRRGPQPGGH